MKDAKQTQAEGMAYELIPNLNQDGRPSLWLAYILSPSYSL